MKPPDRNRPATSPCDSVPGVTSPTTPEAERERIVALIRSAGGRMTVPTRQLITILTETERHLTADDLIAEVERRTPGVAASTIYRLLQRLDELRVIEHVHSGSGAAFYHLRAHGHAHLVCSDCGVIIDIPDTAFAQLASTSRQLHNFTIEPHHSALLGQCETCSA